MNSGTLECERGEETAKSKVSPSDLQQIRDTSPNHIDSSASLGTLSAHQRFLEQILNGILSSLPLSLSLVPRDVQCVLKDVHLLVLEKSSFHIERVECLRTVVGGFLFLRFLCPTLIGRTNDSVLKERMLSLSPSVKKELLKMSKVLQCLSNGTGLAKKEEGMKGFDIFLKQNT